MKKLKKYPNEPQMVYLGIFFPPNSTHPNKICGRIVAGLYKMKDVI